MLDVGSLAPDAVKLRLILVRRGHLFIQNNRRRWFIPAPACIARPEHDSMDFSLGENSEAYSLSFDPRLINPRLTPDFLAGRNEPPLPPDSDRMDRDLMLAFLRPLEGCPGMVVPFSLMEHMASLWQLMHDEADRPPEQFGPCRRRSACMELLIIVQRLATATPVTAMSAPSVSLGFADPLVDSMIPWLNEHWQEKLSISYLASHFGTNRTSLQERFRACTGQTIFDWLNRYRLHQAAIRLASTPDTVKSVALHCGFTDARNFTRQFSALFGSTPGAFRAGKAAS